ncbi:MAG: hypothetical protein LKI94_10185 [Sporolactobacillus sp.]|jgi:hypothetical protein|nr:hypothetical protein [Sporolactobacillus sp.]MCI1882540.1 hypothetical protein [Sporolactobacillus sp.]
MKALNQTLSRQDAEKRIPIVRREIDTQLAVLLKALREKDAERVNRCKRKLELLRREMLLLEI